MREDALTEALDHVIATRVFGPDRHAFLRQGLAGLPDRRHTAEARRRAIFRGQIEDLSARQDRLIAELETTDPADRAFRDRLRRRFDSLEAERADKTAQLHDLDNAATSQPHQEVSLLDALPILEHITITDAPELIQRKLYDALQLQIHYDRPDQARFRLVLTEDTVDTLATATGRTVTRRATNGAHENRTPPEAPTCAIEPAYSAKAGATIRADASYRRFPRCRHCVPMFGGTRRASRPVHLDPHPT